MFSSNTTQVSSAANYIEDVFSTFLYTGNGSTQTITNGIDLSTYGGLVWTKNRIQAYNHTLISSATGVGYQLESNTTSALANGGSAVISSFNTTGFSVGNAGRINYSGDGIVSWTFRKQPKFFDVVTFTSAASGNTTFNHNLGSTPGCVIIKNTQTADPWLVYHRSIGNNYLLYLNTTGAQDPLTNAWSVSSTQVTISSSLMYTSQTYVAYIFAHDAGGFGLTGTDNVITCGSFSGTAGNTLQTVTLGYEPQWLLVKATSTANNWIIVDNMRGFTVDGTDNRLMPNLSDAEVPAANLPRPVATGFQHNYGAADFIYIAIRRGPMKTPTSGTSVYSTSTGTSSASTGTFSSPFPVDWGFLKDPAGTFGWFTSSRLTSQYSMTLNTTGIESGPDANYSFDSNVGWAQNFASTRRSWMFRRAPGFFDEVCWSGNDVNGRTLYHNLNAVPELIITKTRNGTYDWYCYSATLGNTGMIRLNSANPGATGYSMWNSTTPTSTYFKVDNGTQINTSGFNYVAYLFASCPGVSKVGSYTGTGTTKQIDCGFTGGARFVLIKRTDSTGDWYVWDSARGIVAGNDPYLLLNSTAAEVTTTDYIDTYSAGFEISSTAPAAINANGGTFIFLAIA